MTDSKTGGGLPWDDEATKAEDVLTPAQIKASSAAVKEEAKEIARLKKEAKAAKALERSRLVAEQRGVPFVEPTPENVAAVAQDVAARQLARVKAKTADADALAQQLKDAADAEVAKAEQEKEVAREQREAEVSASVSEWRERRMTVAPMLPKDDVDVEYSMPKWGEAEVSEDMQAAQTLSVRAVSSLSVRRSADEELADEIRLEPNLVKRAKALSNAMPFKWAEEKFIRVGDMTISQPVSCDSNRMAFFDMIFGDGEDRPHIDLFSGRMVDHNKVIIDDHYNMIEILTASGAAGLKSQSVRDLKASLREWSLGRKQNDLIISFERQLPEWDGKRRAQHKLINLFSTFKTDLNKKFGQYFWLSLYARIMHPGCMAPIALSLFGPQDAGKSYMSKLICRTLMSDQNADAVQLDLGVDPIKFLRDITGTSIIANIGEMTGFNTADMNKVKSFMTLTSDKMHQKFEGHYDQQRQWITVMDGNRYEGLQRDETGNRRFYPMLVGQHIDANGKESAAETYSADFTGFVDDLWQIMAECREWLHANDGMSGYNKFVGEVVKEVAAFNLTEMNNNRGTPRDQALENYLTEALMSIEVMFYNRRVKKGAFVKTGDISSRITDLSRGHRVMDNRLKVRMLAMGAKPEQMDGYKGYMFEGVMDDVEYMGRVIAADSTEDEDITRVTRTGGKGNARNGASEGAGF